MTGIEKRLKQIVPNWEAFKYKEELVNFVNDIPLISADGFNMIDNTSYKTVIQPFYEWLLKLKVFKPVILEELQVIIRPHNFKTKQIAILILPISELILPKTLRNIVIETSLKTMTQGIRFQDIRTLLIDESTYEIFIATWANGGISDDIRFFKKIEQVALDIIVKVNIKYHKVIDNDTKDYSESLGNLLQSSKLKCLNMLVRNHYKMLHNIKYTYNNTDFSAINNIIENIDFYVQYHGQLEMLRDYATNMDLVCRILTDRIEDLLRIPS